MEIKWLQRVGVFYGDNKVLALSELWISFDIYEKIKKDISSLKLPNNMVITAQNNFVEDSETYVIVDREVLLTIRCDRVNMDHSLTILNTAEELVNEIIYRHL